jgi:hypothetical protein
VGDKVCDGAPSGVAAVVEFNRKGGGGFNGDGTGVADGVSLCRGIVLVLTVFGLLREVAME